MKTTVDLSDALLEEAKVCAREQGLSMKNLVEEGLRMAIDRRHEQKQPFKMRDGSFGGEGMGTDLTWPQIRELIYEGRGE